MKIRNTGEAILQFSESLDVFFSPPEGHGFLRGQWHGHWNKTPEEVTVDIFDTQKSVQILVVFVFGDAVTASTLNFSISTLWCSMEQLQDVAKQCSYSKI